MGTEMTAAAFEAAFHDNDCQTLIQAIETFAASRSTTPDNIIDVLPCVHSGMIAIFARKEEEARKAWKTGEARAWREARATFDRGMCEFIHALQATPNPEQATTDAPLPNSPRPSSSSISSGWGNSERRAAIGAGWGKGVAPKHDPVPTTH
jgi:hypothetical protein